MMRWEIESDCKPVELLIAVLVVVFMSTLRARNKWASGPVRALAGLLARGGDSVLAFPIRRSVACEGTHRLQLRGQPRFCALMGTSHRVPFSSLPPWASGWVSLRLNGLREPTQVWCATKWREVQRQVAVARKTAAGSSPRRTPAG